MTAINPLATLIISKINNQLINFSARYDPKEHDILVTDHHHNQFRLAINGQAKLIRDQLKYLTFENATVNNAVELTNNNQLGDYLVCLNLIYTTIANYQPERKQNYA